MNIFQLVKELARGITFYKKQFYFFLTLFLIGLFSYSLFTYKKELSADLITAEESFTLSNSQEINLYVTKDGRIIKDGQTVSRIILGNQYDELRYNVLDNPGLYVDNLTVKVKFSPVLSKDIYYRTVAAHTGSGLDGNNFNENMLNDHTIIYKGWQLSPETSFTVKARLPKGLIAPPWWRSSSFNITSLPSYIWVILGSLLPVITLILLVIMLIQRHLASKVEVNTSSSIPPEKLPPAIVGVLLHGRITPRELSATFIDLAERDYIHIFEDHTNFSFGRGKSLESEKIFDLLPFEKLLLSKIFEKNTATVSLQNISNELGKDLFSQKIAQVYLEIYNQISNKGYFHQNPGLTQQKYRMSGMILFLVSLIGFILNSFLNKNFPFMIFFWVGMMIAATLILYFAPKMPILTEKGRQARQSWLQFKKYMEESGSSSNSGDDAPYSKYLSYSIVLGSEVNWTKHFATHPFYCPNWYDSDPQTKTIEEFANTLFPLIAYTSNTLASSRIPVIN